MDKLRRSDDTQYKSLTTVADEHKVVYNFVGKSGLRVSNICLGTLTFGEAGPVGLSDWQ